MAYRIAGIDVHKRMLAVVVADVEVEGEYEFERQLFGATPQQLRSLAGTVLETALSKKRWGGAHVRSAASGTGTV